MTNPTPGMCPPATTVGPSYAHRQKLAPEVITRLKESKRRHDVLAERLGKERGTHWACTLAEYAELAAIARYAESTSHFELGDVLRITCDGDNDSEESFVRDLMGVDDTYDGRNPSVLSGFIDGVYQVWDAIKRQI